MRLTATAEMLGVAQILLNYSLIMQAATIAAQDAVEVEPKLREQEASNKQFTFVLVL